MVASKKKTTSSTSKKRLGKGLDDIFGGDLTSFIDDIEKNSSKSTQISVPVDKIRPNPYQPRRLFDEEKLNELAVSIKQHGIFTPLILKESVHGYDIVAGERRFRAAKIAELTEVPAIIVNLNDDQMMEIALLENIQRENLNAIEEAQAYRTMMNRLKITQEQLASRLGKSRTHITNTLRLLQLTDTIQNYVLEGKLSMGHVRALITLEPAKAEEIALRAINEKLSVRDVENIVRGIELSKNNKKKEKPKKDAQFEYAEGLIRKKFRTKVKIENQTLTLKFTDIDDLNRILELMGVIEES